MKHNYVYCNDSSIHLYTRYIGYYITSFLIIFMFMICKTINGCYCDHAHISSHLLQSAGSYINLFPFQFLLFSEDLLTVQLHMIYL